MAEAQAKRRPDYRAFVSDGAGENGKPKFKEIGAGWSVKSDGISFRLKEVPEDKQFVVFPVRP